MYTTDDIMERLVEVKEHFDICFGIIIKNEGNLRKVFDARNALADSLEELPAACLYADLEDICYGDDFGHKVIINLLNYECDDYYLDELRELNEELIDDIEEDENEYVYEFDYRQAIDIKADLQTIQRKLEFEGTLGTYEQVYKRFKKIDDILSRYC